MLGICRVCSKSFDDTEENTNGPEAVCSRDCLLKLRGENNNKLLTDDTRQLIIEKIIEQNIKDAKENDGIETMAHCDRFNGIKGYTYYTDRELLEVCVFWLFGIDIEWGKK